RVRKRPSRAAGRPRRLPPLRARRAHALGWSLARLGRRDVVPALEPRSAGDLDVGRRRRPPDLPGPGSLGRGEARSDRPRAALHRGADATRLRLSGAPLRELLERPVAATDGSPRPPEGELRRAALPAPGADRADRTEALRDAARRQRLELVHQRRAEPRLVERPTAHAGAGEGLGLRGRGRVVAAPALARVGRVEIPVAADPRDPAAVLARLQGETADHTLAAFDDEPFLVGEADLLLGIVELRGE